MIIHVARVLLMSTVVVTDQLLMFLKIMAMERSRCRGGGADYKLHKTSSSVCIGSGNSSKHSQGKSGNFIFEFEWEP